MIYACLSSAGASSLVGSMPSRSLIYACVRVSSSLTTLSVLQWHLGLLMKERPAVATVRVNMLLIMTKICLSPSHLIHLLLLLQLLLLLNLFLRLQLLLQLSQLIVQIVLVHVDIVVPV